jgi:lipopolysaccharide/colanic/teichoic acid biosynthesis glycosyltransferase
MVFQKLPHLQKRKLEYFCKKMIKRLLDFLIGIFGICIFCILFVMALSLMVLVASFCFALLPYVIFGLVCAWLLNSVISNNKT